jgi:uncharacterized protein (DUF2141 family)
MLKKNLHWAIYFLFCLSCAKQAAPTGGPKDTIPPILIRSTPKNETVNFSGRNIELEFSEMIDASTAKDQLIITPTLGKDFEVRTKRNLVIVDIKKNLDPNTTYSFNFRESVKDVTEKNPAKKLQLAISTGLYIDSLSISGTISDLLKAKPSKEVTVAVHVPNDTFNILKHPGAILTKTDEKGNFKIDYLKPGKYYLYAFDDKNKNLIVDSRTESYNFLKAPLELKNDTAKINLGLIKLDARPLKLTSARPYNTYFNVRGSKTFKNFNIAFDSTAQLVSSFSEDQSNIKIYSKNPVTDSVKFDLFAIDSIGNRIDTTLYAKFLTREVTPEKFAVAIESSSIIASKGTINVELKFSKPIKQVKFDSLYYQLDSTKIFRFQEQDLQWDTEFNKLKIFKQVDKTLLVIKPPDENKKPEEKPKTVTPEKNTKPEKNAKEREAPKPITNELVIGKATFISIDSDSSKRMTQQLQPRQAEDLSEIIYTIRTSAKTFLVQLLDKEFHILQQTKNKLKGSFQDLEAGNYILRVVNDDNDNGSWDPGNYLKRIEPEKITYYKSGEKAELLITLKSNWELELSPLLVTY